VGPGDALPAGDTVIPSCPYLNARRRKRIEDQASMYVRQPPFFVGMGRELGSTTRQLLA